MCLVNGLIMSMIQTSWVTHLTISKHCNESLASLALRSLMSESKASYKHVTFLTVMFFRIFNTFRSSVKRKSLAYITSYRSTGTTAVMFFLKSLVERGTPWGHTTTPSEFRFLPGISQPQRKVTLSGREVRMTTLTNEDLLLWKSAVKQK